MPEIKASLQLQLLFERISTRSSSLLALDYDGTLAPFHVDRLAAVPYPGVTPLIQAIQAAGSTRLVLVSGRPVSEVRQLIGLDSAPEIWGSHGRERAWPDGRIELVEPTKEESAALKAVEVWIEDHKLSHLAERKAGSIAIHWRGLPAEETLVVSSAAQRAMRPIADRAEMSLLEFDGGIELRPLRPNKGSAVRVLLNEMPAGTPFAYLGDDTTDEDAFAALRETDAMTVLVRPEWRETEAKVWIQPPDELLEFLRRWLDATGGQQ